MTEKDVDEFIEFCRAENMKLHAQYVIEYCESHKNCKECTFFNGTCRLNNIPANWTLTPKG